MTEILLAVALTAGAAQDLKVDVEFSIVRPNGVREAKTLSKTWYFDVPAKRADKAAMTELIHRIFFDANVKLRQREPDDKAWLTMVSFKTSPVDTKGLAEWDFSGPPMPWYAADWAIVWEPGACFFVADDGRYDTMQAPDFTELLMNRMLDAKAVTKDQFVSFFEKMYPKPPGNGQKLYDARAERVKNLVSVRTGPWRKTPGAKPIASGPVEDVIKSLSHK